MSDRPPATDTLAAGVIGVGSMGRHHARVYSELPDVELVGVTDVDTAAAESVAAEYGTQAMSREELLAAADIVSIAVPTPYHYETAVACIDNDVDILIEKPFVEKLDQGRDLAERAREAGVTLQVGHIERFNPATSVLSEIVPDLDIVAIDIDRLGPPVDRGGDDSVVMDLMIHDIDILLSLVDGDIDSMSAAARDEGHANVQFEFDDGAIASLTASRLTQQKVRQLSVTAESCRVNVDFISQTVEIHRHSMPEYIESNGDIRFRHESVVERPIVDNGEPLKAELAAFVTSAREGSEPVVTAEDGLRVLAVANEIEALTEPTERMVPQQ
ncbi:Gfo/Idh/MocA family oxidoreductase [Halonotius terrestris]|uniref:Gfo/Idh/MocA family oxidoreductase n=1 Tax=Halonotius terrestris TaxID=2487750 RepID=A0A8J8TAT8_9EURY|nr:Gfo/Idh/MocA family oxidoreductase [Halonotius terrestris]TQQ79344.1 Gfo/Idh/MocA family oxidoreductase [Halonotius terrestris]